MHDAFKMSMMGELNFFLRLQIKQMEDGIFFNQSKYIKDMLKKFGLEDSKPMKTPMSSDTKLTKDEECESVDSTKYRGIIGLSYPKETGIETVVYVDSDHVGDYVDRKSTSGICTFVGCCLTSWFSKKQTALAISTTEAEYGQVTRTKNKKTIFIDKNEILTREVQPHMKPWVDIIHENAICLGGHKDHVSVCLSHILYCIESSTPYNLAFFILKRMEKTQNKPKELLPYEMLLTRLFKLVVFVFPDLAIDHYLLHDRVMHPFAPHYERKTRSDHDVSVDVNNEESFHSNSSSPSQNVSSSSNVVPRVRHNPPRESQHLNTYLSETINLQTQQRDDHRKGLTPIGQALKDMMSGKRK
uniref:Copia protein n=1 Tax=Tanacetum cinerariifolium TaxID=118510 RepID=A0A699HS17_TANCI|nr:copia protein [Tanacetum cinerariifolium]